MAWRARQPTEFERAWIDVQAYDDAPTVLLPRWMFFGVVLASMMTGGCILALVLNLTR